jgi:serine/threonine-protein kinase
MSPEQVWNHEVGFSSDVWALAVVTLEMLTGVQPFVDDSMAKIFERIVREPVPKICSLNGQLPSGVEAVFERAFERDPTRRIQSPKEFAAAFEEAMKPVPASTRSAASQTLSEGVETSAATPAAPHTPAHRRTGGRRSLVKGGLAALALGALGVGWAVAVRGLGSADEPSLRQSTPGANSEGAASPEPAPEQVSPVANSAPIEPRVPGDASARAEHPASLASSASTPPEPTSPRPPRSAPKAPGKPEVTRDPRFGVPVSD